MEHSLDDQLDDGGSSVPPRSFRADNNQNSVVVQAGGDAQVHLHQRPLLPVRPISPVEIKIARQAWVKVDAQGAPLAVATRLHDVIAVKRHGLAVVSGERGSGRSGAAVKALVLLAEGRRRESEVQLRLEQITPDWDPPNVELLPTDGNCGYLLDVSTEIGAWKNRTDLVEALIGHGRKLAEVGSCLLVISDKDSWPTIGASADHLVEAVRPSPYLLCTTHLKRLFNRPELARQLDPSHIPGEEEVRLSGLVKENMHPEDAGHLARLLASTDGSPEAIKDAVEAFGGWKGRIKQVFDGTRDEPEDRALLLAAVFLEGSGPATVQKAARVLLGEKAESDVRRILSGLDLGSRLSLVGAEVIENRVSFAHRPGYRVAVLRHVWTQLADVQQHLKKWIKAIVAPGKEGVDHLEAIADLLAELAVTEKDLSILPSPPGGSSRSEPDPLSQGAVAARMLAAAAQTPTFGSVVRTQLRERWAKHDRAEVAQVAALVCQGAFAAKYPRQALVRLRWVLRRPEEDVAVVEALEAVRQMAVEPRLLPDVWTAVVEWIGGGDLRAGQRAFLALVDPSRGPAVLKTLIRDAEQDPRVTEELIVGWGKVLSDVSMADRCEALFSAWAEIGYQGEIPGETLADILDRVVMEHLGASPVSAFLMGRAGVGYPPSVIDMRRRLMERRGFTSLVDERQTQGNPLT